MVALLNKKWPPAAEVSVGGESISVIVKVSKRAKNYKLSIPHGQMPLLTVPKFGRWTEARSFLGKNAEWLAERLEDAVKPVPFVRGAVIPLRGVNHRLVPTGRVRGVVEVSTEDSELVLLVPGGPEHHARRLLDWLKEEAAKDLAARSHHHARTLGVSFKSIVMRNQSTRWGSCSTTGKLNYNWRLILAPPFALDYVAAHEIAHLVEMNHSDRFWNTVKKTLPTMEAGRDWMRDHGRELMAYGVETR